MRKTLLGLIMVILLCLVGCRSHKEIATETDPREEETAIAPVVKKICFTATFDCEVENINVSGLLRMQEDSIIWVCVNKFIELGRGTLTPDSVHVYAKILNRYFSGNYQNVEKKTGYKTDFKSLQDIFLDAYRTGRKHITIPIASKQINTTVTIDIKKLERASNLSYPMSIPKSAKLW